MGLYERRLGVFKRTWSVFVAALAIGLLLSACGGGELADDLTPIPTLPKGEEPELVEAIQAGATAVAVGEVVETPPDDGETGEDPVVVGQTVFVGQGCAGCHGAVDGAGPAFTGMGARVRTRVPGQSAEDYLHESIVDPGAFLVDGYPNIMPANYGEILAESEIDGLVAYILAESGEVGETADEEGPVEGTEPEDDEEPADQEAVDEVATQDQPEEPDNGDTADEPEGTEPVTDGENSIVVTGDPVQGEQLFVSCSACHEVEDAVGPSLPGMVKEAATRVEGQSAEEYLHESIVDPSAYVVEGFSDIMPKNYAELFSEAELVDLIAYILTQ
jgi:mono/diheme cytochrome c family protein